MKTLKTGVMLLALLLAAMAMVPMVNAADIQAADAHQASSDAVIDSSLKGIVIQTDPYTYVFTGKTDNKTASVDHLMTNLNKKTKSVATASSGTPVSGANSASLPLFGSSIYQRTTITGSYDGGWTSPYSKYVSGNLLSNWQGTSPYYADKITLASQVSASGVGVSISMPGGSMGYQDIGGNRLAYSDYWTNAYAVTHSYTNFLAQSWATIPSIQESDSGTFRFSYSDYTVNTYVSV
ncbi:conserved hypothetical protein [Methanoregula boonei 6A8]|jgi:hypothetical protein|uniref:Uncharacterized protein n=1 Tax=Methanoregula boonei (strain DSM 21154 / JCM 14090 / 6A8) TaxID=456442 RepID=A7I572_METB6|nr:hypothetical protein [Methanoregula boonei]ABS54883.1 conserved hypothetical protein [Methanoregula boonei 6A8]